MKKIIITLLCAWFMLFAAVYADDTDIDVGDGTGAGTGTSENYWMSGWHGVRITLAENVSGSRWAVHDRQDFANSTAPTESVKRYFKFKCKLEYLSGKTLKMVINEPYPANKTLLTLPTLFNEHGIGSKEEIIGYFKNKNIISEITNHLSKGKTHRTGVPLIQYIKDYPSKFTLVIEPIFYCVYRGQYWAGTATEWAMYDEERNGGVDAGGNSFMRKRFWMYTHLNVPLSMFLEKGAFGVMPPTEEEKRGRVHFGDGSSAGLPTGLIKSKLGIAVVKKEGDTPVDPVTESVTYICDTDVITSVWIVDTDGGGKNTKDPAYVTFNIGGAQYTHSGIYIPPGGSVLAWVKWHTPKEPGRVTITMSSNCALLVNEYDVKIGKVNVKVPPDPNSTDRNDNFNYGIKPPNRYSNADSNSWVVYDCYWQSVPVALPGGGFVDNGYWVYTPITYTATIDGRFEVMPDVNCPTREGKTMGSGYGFTAKLISNVMTNLPTSAVTEIQTATVYFPEFKYKEYGREMEENDVGMTLKVNKCSHFDSRVHFTPVWFKDGAYTVYVEARSVWTPAGELKRSFTDSLEIRGSVFDDWRAVPVRE
ncbi:hypothetical protein [Bacteroides heparinolyticus]|uniref:hypothetical protein n=1 Tax=Prevotella heparinolytica TaxID=28113 RepID=UPI00359F28F0